METKTTTLLTSNKIMEELNKKYVFDTALIFLNSNDVSKTTLQNGVIIKSLIYLIVLLKDKKLV